MPVRRGHNKAKPKEVRDLEGDRSNGKADVAETPPEFDEAEDTAPPFLSERAVSIWHDLEPALRANGMLTVADVPAFAMLCDAYATWQEMVEMTQRAGFSPFESKGDGGHRLSLPSPDRYYYF